MFATFLSNSNIINDEYALVLDIYEYVMANRY